MHARLATLLLLMPALSAAAPADSGLMFPLVGPERANRCVYSGVFPGAGFEAPWTILVKPNGDYSIELSAADQLNGVLRQRIGEQPFMVTEWKLGGWERPGRLSRSRDSLSATVKVAGGLAYFTVSVDLEEVCRDLPAKKRPGDRWTCTETLRDTWTAKGSIDNQGTDPRGGQVVWTYIRTEEVQFNGEPVVAALVERKSADSHTQTWLDPTAPWCALRIDRIKMGDRIVGTDTLTARQELANTPENPPVGPEAAPGGSKDVSFFAVAILVGFAFVVLFVWGIMWIAGWHARRRNKDV